MAGGERRERQCGGGSQGTVGRQNTPGPGIGSRVCPASCWDFFLPDSHEHLLFLRAHFAAEIQDREETSVESLMGGRRCSHTNRSPSSLGGTLLAPGAVTPRFLSQGPGPFGGCTGVQGPALGWEGGDAPSRRQRPAVCPCSLPQMGSTA